MATIKHGKIVEDSVVHLEDDELVPPHGAFTVSVKRWLAEREELSGTEGLGLRLNGTDELDDILDDIDQFERIALEFPEFTDGRCYSFARLLRERHDYDGELRAVGDVLRDQLFFMRRCGIDAYEIPEGKDPEAALAAFEDFSVTYQTAADGRPPVYHQSSLASAAE